nr:hypothetical protein Iba_chr10fCG11430 [Ipomoea batatas]
MKLFHFLQAGECTPCTEAWCGALDQITSILHKLDQICTIFTRGIGGSGSTMVVDRLRGYDLKNTFKIVFRGFF